MKRLLLLLLVFTMLFTLISCGEKETNQNVVHEDNELTVNKDAVTEPVEEPIKNEIVEEHKTYDSLEDFFPEDWDGRYIITKVENVSTDVFCKSTSPDKANDGWLFQLMLMDSFPDYLPAATNLGTYNGKVVVAAYPENLHELNKEDVSADYYDMASDVEDILHQILHHLGGEHDHQHPINTGTEEPNIPSNGTYVTPDSLGINHTFVGVFRLDCSYWSEESKNELLAPNNQYGFLSIAADGTAYLSRGDNITKGTALIYSDPNNVPDDKHLYEITFDGKTYYANMVQLVLTIDDMPEFSNPEGLKGTSWTFLHETDDWWTEDTFRDDIG